MNFSGKTALVTGAATGIGRACAVKFAQGGAKVVIADINTDKLESVKEEIEKYTKDVIAAKCDISDEKQVYKTIEKAADAFGKIDILINNAALWRDCSAVVDTPTEIWHRYFDVNVFGTLYCIKAVLPEMIKAGYGKIINVSSIAGVYGKADMAHYSATKGAVISLTRALAKEVIGSGVCVNCVSPGTVSQAENPDMDYYEVDGRSYAGRTGTDNENASLICFLASDDAEYIVGQNIQIDGCRRIL